MHTLHSSICVSLQAAAGTANRDQSTDSYTGSTHMFYAVPMPVRRQLIKNSIKQHASLSDRTWLKLADQLFFGASHEEKTMGAIVLQYRPAARALVRFPQLRRWLRQLAGWAEIDALCYNVYTADELLTAWPAWEAFLTDLAKSRHRTLRRAALVFLCGPVAHSTDARLHNLAFQSVTQLALESDILITKAISWLLRSQVDTQKSMVAVFVAEHATQLPKIAVRETRRKLETGKKNR